MEGESGAGGSRGGWALSAQLRVHWGRLALTLKSGLQNHQKPGDAESLGCRIPGVQAVGRRDAPCPSPRQCAQFRVRTNVCKPGA